MSLRVLCIEDESGLREDIVLELEDAGYLVDCAADGDAGIAALAENDYALVLCDMQVPRANGLEVFAAMTLSAGDRPRPPFFILTAFSDPALRIRCQKLGVEQVLVKPVDYAILLALIAAEIGQ